MSEITALCPCCGTHVPPKVYATAIDAYTFVGVVDCSMCTLTVTEQVGERTEDKAILSITSLWNTIGANQ